ncbi:hypothetical protein BU14_0072s0051 [Porphyra umbilicalis]|uniref:Uncharacterized protein n=1 Tax=Porphyra umbilicalis TaxID=2786 RepID=A0A1X6PG94_PORUM|nr:hypothetical protein BU14_0072s0051 [Porphyra umbilicalis]|eukprot:OSX79693.1 hypothetical protein BU14_0072s0051 [Porphyra umbilicalis]
MAPLSKTFLAAAAAVAVAAVASTAAACRCAGPPSVATSYASASTVIRATAVSTSTDLAGGRLFYQLVNVAYIKGCAPLGGGGAPPRRLDQSRVAPQTTVTVATAASSAACGAVLPLGEPLILFLHGGASPDTLHSCDAHTRVAALAPADASFLHLRRVAGGARCPAPCGPPVPCATKRHPCGGVRPPCADAVKCVIDPCDGCSALWLTKRGEAAVCKLRGGLVKAKAVLDESRYVQRG